METEKKEYSNGEVTVVWQPKMCIHSAICIKGLHSVFNTQKRPWINMGAADTASIVKQVEQCPSGALSYFYNNKETSNSNKQNMDSTSTKVEIIPNGPAVVYGACTLKVGGEEQYIEKEKTFLCRCGASEKKPFCDGSHKKIGFQG